MDKRDFRFTDQHFEFIRKLAYQISRINLTDQKKDLVYARLARRIRALRMQSFDDYCTYLENNQSDELTDFLNALTTNLTYFFRENHHFEFLRDLSIPYWLKKHQMDKRIRIWSAGCSTGEEAYSIAITLMETIPDIDNWDVKILATDLDSNVINKGKSGVYDQQTLEKMNPTQAEKWFQKGVDKNEGLVKVHPDLQKIITFKELNLFDSWPFSGPFDALFCRNVVIYFDNKTQKQLFSHFERVMAADAWLFVGHSESLHQVTDQFNLIGKSTYGKVNGPHVL